MAVLCLLVSSWGCCVDVDVLAVGLWCVFCCWGCVVGLLTTAFVVINSVGSCISFGLA